MNKTVAQKSDEICDNLQKLKDENFDNTNKSSTFASSSNQLGCDKFFDNVYAVATDAVENPTGGRKTQEKEASFASQLQQDSNNSARGASIGRLQCYTDAEPCGYKGLRSVSNKLPNENMVEISNLKRPSEAQYINEIADKYFRPKFIAGTGVGRIDFEVKDNNGSLFWAEVKEKESDAASMITQLVLTLRPLVESGNYMPPKYIGCFDTTKIVFLEYFHILDLFRENDFDWIVTPSSIFNPKKDDALKIRHMIEVVGKYMEDGIFFDFSSDANDIKSFIKLNFVGETTQLISVSKNNYQFVYQKWENSVLPTINVKMSDIKKEYGVYPCDFFIADLFVTTETRDRYETCMSLANHALMYNKTIAEVQREAGKNGDYLYDYSRKGGLNAVRAGVITENEFDVYGKLYNQLSEPSKKNLLCNDFINAEIEYPVENGLKVIRTENKYKIRVTNGGLLTPEISIDHADGGKEYKTFWSKYERPPKEEQREYIKTRKDNLVSQKIRETTGAYFTSNKWSELSKQYITDVYGENWQDEYYIWDPAAGTGNLLKGLINPNNIFASTLDDSDVYILKNSIEKGNHILYTNQVFQFDFLNDDFSKLPVKLQNIIKDEPEKLIIYMNPPYGENGNGGGSSQGTIKKGIADTKTNKKYLTKYGKGMNELFIQFLVRIKEEIGGSHIAIFSKLKILLSPSAKKFRDNFNSTYQKGFVVHSNGFDNVRGHFPIMFTIWDLNNNPFHSEFALDIFDNNSEQIGVKSVHVSDDLITKWVARFYDTYSLPIAQLGVHSSDFEHQNYAYIANKTHEEVAITLNNLKEFCIHNAVRHAFAATWLNDRDQFEHPYYEETECDEMVDAFHKKTIRKYKYQDDEDFIADCLAFSLFDRTNNIKSAEGINHWIPFTPEQMGIHEAIESRFMIDYIKKNNIVWTSESQAVYDAALKIWQYYHKKACKNVKYTVNASLYDIKAFFKGTNPKGRMNTKSTDENFNKLMNDLSAAIKKLKEAIQPKVYEYGFLRI